MAASELLVVVARYPTPGRVKTRLGRAIGMERSAALYRAMLADFEARLRDLPWPHAWAFGGPESAVAACAELFPPGACCFGSGSDRLAEALRDVFVRLEQGGCERLVVVSSDSPHLPLDSIAQAFAALGEFDVVLGPTEDGGYSLIGQRAPMHDLFTALTLSTAAVLRQTVELCQSRGLSHTVLPQTFDIDELADLRRLRDLIGSGLCPPLPRTSAALERLGELI